MVVPVPLRALTVAASAKKAAGAATNDLEKATIAKKNMCEAERNEGIGSQRREKDGLEGIATRYKREKVKVR